MPKGPRGERRPADVVGCAVTVAKIATGEIEDTEYEQPNKVRAGLAGARARSQSLTLGAPRGDRSNGRGC